MQPMDKDLLDTLNFVMSTGFTICGALWVVFLLFINSKFKATEDSLNAFKKVSKSDDNEVKTDLGKEMDKRVDQITSLHMRVGVAEKEHSILAQRMSYMEGLHKKHE